MTPVAGAVVAGAVGGLIRYSASPFPGLGLDPSLGRRRRRRGPWASRRQPPSPPARTACRSERHAERTTRRTRTDRL